MYMVLRVGANLDASVLSDVIKLGMVTQEELDAGMHLLESAKLTSGCYPVVYVCSVKTDSTNYHICLLPDGRTISASAVGLLSAFPTKQYDGSTFVNTFVKGLMYESYDNYGSTVYDSFRSRDNIFIKSTLNGVSLIYGDYTITLKYSDETLTINKPIKKADITVDAVKRLNSAIYALYNKEKFMLIETGDEYLLLKI
jgi:hypothetical protein